MVRLIRKYLGDLRRFRFRLGRFRARFLAVRERERRGSYERYSSGALHRLFLSPKDLLSDEQLTGLRGVADRYAVNQFDILGSGWVETRFGARCRGFRGHRYSVQDVHTGQEYWSSQVNSSNSEYAKSVSALIDADYTPIDWQRDCKSGFRWESKAPSQDAQIGEVPGSDIKIPWELSKLQHLPQLAVAYGSGVDPGGRYVEAFRNQVLDFVATNPPGYGVNWCTAMLAGIRAGNILVAYDLFRASGAEFDEPFEGILFRSVLDHARFIVSNLEWWVDDNRNNHFLANVAGLAAICAYLPETEETNDMLSLVIRSLIHEAVYQFNKDGSSTEGSTAYHAFAAELIAWSVVFIESIPLERRRRSLTKRGSTLPKFARWVGWSRIQFDVDEQFVSPREALSTRLQSAASFFEDCLDTNHRLVQIGDNDSGRFLKLCPTFSRLTQDEAIARYCSLDGYAPPADLVDYWDEDLLDYFGTGAVLDATCNSQFDEYRGALEYRLARTLLDMHSGFPTDSENEERRLFRHGFDPASVDVGSTTGRTNLDVSVGDDGALRILRFSPTPEVRLRSYPQFGLYVYRSDDILLHVKCGGLLTLSSVGHPHDDQLSLNLIVNGCSVLTDPGSFVYTAAPAARQLYRSKSAHFVPGWTPARRPRSSHMFDSLPDTVPGIVHSVRHNRFIGSLDIDGGTITRTITITPMEIVIKDVDDDGNVIDLAIALEKLSTLPPSEGYGKARRSGSAISIGVSQ